MSEAAVIIGSSVGGVRTAQALRLAGFAISPVLHHGVAEPFLGKVGVVADEDLQVRAEFSGDVVKETEHPADGFPVSVIFRDARLTFDAARVADTVRAMPPAS